MDKRKAFRIFTLLLVGLSVWTAWANVFSDDTEVKAQARELVDKEAGCGDKCKLVAMKGERGMFGITIDYTIDGKGVYVATCRRAFVVAGAYACSVTKG